MIGQMTRLSTLLYIELSNSYVIGRKRTVNIRNQRRDVITAGYTIVMSRTHKVTGNHVKFARLVLFLVDQKAKT